MSMGEGETGEKSRNREYAANWRTYYYVVVGVFYLCEGYAVQFLNTFVPMFMSQVFQLSSSQIGGVMSVVLVATIPKFVYGGISDRFYFGEYGRRHPYLVITGVLGAIVWPLLAFLSTFTLIWVFLLFLAFFVEFFADTVLDALTVDITPPEKRGKVEGTAWGGRGVGMAFGGLVTGFLVESRGWGLPFYIAGILGVAMCFIPLLVQEPPKNELRRFSIESVKKTFTDRNVWLAVFIFLLEGSALSMLTYIGLFGESIILLSSSMIGFSILVLSLANMGGSLLGGWFADHFGTKKGLALGIPSSAVILLMLVFFAPHRRMLFYLFLIVWGFAWGFKSAAVLRMAMQFAPKESAGFTYALFMGLANLGSQIATFTISGLIPIVSLKFAPVITIIPFLLIALLPLYFITFSKIQTV